MATATTMLGRAHEVRGRRRHFDRAIADFGRRDRRFGGVPGTPALTAAE